MPAARHGAGGEEIKGAIFLRFNELKIQRF
jgi:hypothetical protein